MNVFYKMQILLEKVRKVYILYTRWGRIGSDGQNQQTPFATLEEAKKEFSKVFKEKTGNEWTTDIQDTFGKKPKKYQLIKQDLKKVSEKDYLSSFDWNEVSSRRGSPQVEHQVAQLI